MGEYKVCAIDATVHYLLREKSYRW